MNKYEITGRISIESECIERECVSENIIFYQLEQAKYCIGSWVFLCCTTLKIKVLESKPTDFSN